MRSRLFMIFLVLTAQPAMAATVPSSTALATIFTRTCLKYPDNPARLSVWLDANMKPADMHQEGFFLGLRTGKVWLYKEGEANYAVLLLDDGRCAVDADKVDLDAAIGIFEAQAAKAGYKVLQTGDEPRGDFHGVEGHVRSYRLDRLGHGYTVRASGTANPRAVLDSELMLGVAK